MKRYEAVTDNPLITMYINKIENRIILRIKLCYLELLAPETIKLLGSTRSK